MTLRRALLVVAVVAAVALAGCTGGPEMTPTPTDASTPAGTTAPTVDASASEIQSTALESAQNVSRYEATVDGTIAVSANNVEQTIALQNELVIDRPATEYHRSLEQTVRGQTTTVDGYLVDETNYARSPQHARQYGSEWIETDVSGNATQLLDRYDILAQYRKALANASVAVDGATTSGDATLRRLQADLNTTSLDTTFQTGNRTTFTDASVTYWVDREGTIHRVNATFDQTTETSRTTTNRTIVSTIDFAYGDAPIDLPEEARSAVDITDDGESGEDPAGGSDDGSDTDSGEGSDGDGTAESDGDDSAITVRGGDLAVDPDRTFKRVEAVLETNVTDPEAVVAQGPANLTRGRGVDRRTLSDTLGLESASLAGTNVTLGSRDVPLSWLAEGRVDGVGNVYLHSAPGMGSGVTRLLTAHEFVHYVQLQNGRFESVNAGTDTTTDGAYAARATTEGAAVFTTDALLERYVPEGPRNVALYDGIAAAAPNGSLTAYGNSRYVFGTRYVDARIDDPAAIESVYQHPPTTSEQVLHGLAPGSEPPAPLTVTVETGSEYVLAGSDRKGEAYLRYALDNGVSTDRAVAAAAGWGNDTVRSLRPADGEGTTSYVWVQRWDTPGDATEFATVARDYLDSYGTVENGTTTLDGVPARFETLDDRTTALVIGSRDVQSAVTLRTDGGGVVVAETR
ncbi:hypothetical protein [Halapricum salinum]|uniref:Lipoprotein n=1 Tax=Halapricum salinum TaxID=1457250 RepID=A0A4D6HBW3_9EURY|nr:hypothetical protein [Halapricum salinum]QCC51105.1 hypothetical protein DV733_07570 [Halapricum salinum]